MTRVGAKKNRQIISLKSWGTLDSEKWAIIHEYIAKGEEFGVWNGLFRDIPWVSGKCSLKVKVGKKRKLVKGILTLCGGRCDYYGLIFTPRARKLTK